MNDIIKNKCIVERIDLLSNSESDYRLLLRNVTWEKQTTCFTFDFLLPFAASNDTYKFFESIVEPILKDMVDTVQIKITKKLKSERKIIVEKIISGLKSELEKLEN